MRDHIQTAVPSPPELILAEAEVASRMVLLGELQAALAAQEIRSVLARNHRLVLRSNGGPFRPSGQTDPQLYVLTPDGTDIVTTDGTTYSLASGGQCPADDPAGAVAAIRRAAPEASYYVADPLPASPCSPADD